MEEPSILDYLKSRLNPWQKEKIQIPAPPQPAAGESSLPDQTSAAVETVLVEPVVGGDLQSVSIPENKPELAEPLVTAKTEDDMREITIKLRMPMHIPWRTLLALLMALTAQRLLEPPVNSMPLAIGFYIFAVLLIGWAYFDREFALPTAGDVLTQVDTLAYRRNSLFIMVILSVVAFALFSNNLFTRLNITIWLAAIGFFLYSLWVFRPDQPTPWARWIAFLRRDPWHVTITRWSVLLFGVCLLILFFRFYRLEGIPGEPFSDHAEKLLDVYDLTQGQTQIFFPRNTGREFIQFYLTAFIAEWFGTGLTFMSLKIGTVLIGLFTLPFIYLIGKEVGGKRVAMFALMLAGTSYWLNTISRIGLRFPLYPAFAAPALYFLIRGLRRQTRNDFILAGLFLGLGLHGYSPYRFIPFVMLLGVGLYLLHRHSSGHRKQTIVMFSILVLASILVFLPLMRYSIENPEMFSYRALSRLTGQENPLPAPAWQIFLSNTFNAMTMFNYDDGEIWVHSIPHRPALDFVSGALFVFGYLFLIVRYLHKRDWLDLFIVLSVPMLLMPSILSLAFPAENPSLNRTGAAAVIVFVVAGMALDAVYTSISANTRRGGWQTFATVLVLALLLVSTLQNYNLVFDKFATQFLRGAWNTSDMGRIIRTFVASGNKQENVFVVPYPHWVDTRLVGIQAGYPTRDYALWRDNLSNSVSLSGSKLFMVKEDDQQTLDVLRQLYPAGLLGHFTSPLEGKNFWIYTVPDNQAVNP